MNSWSVLFIALAAVVLQAWVSRRGAPGWYMGCIIPLLYGAAVAWMFVGQDFLRALWVILLGSALPITLLISLGERTSPPPGSPRFSTGLRRTMTKGLAERASRRIQPIPRLALSSLRTLPQLSALPSPSPHPVSLQSFSLTYKKAQPGLPDSLNRQRPGGSLLRVFFM